MPAIDPPYVDKVEAALSDLPADRSPAWGKMTPAQMMGHLRMTVMYTCGAGPDMPFRGNWKSKMLFKPLVLNGIVAIPHNVKLPRPKGVKELPPPPEATVNDVVESMRTFLDNLHGGKLSTRMHPFFGPLTPKAWAKFHHAHFTHHLKQFGLHV